MPMGESGPSHQAALEGSDQALAAGCTSTRCPVGNSRAKKRREAALEGEAAGCDRAEQRLGSCDPGASRPCGPEPRPSRTGIC